MNRERASEAEWSSMGKLACSMFRSENEEEKRATAENCMKKTFIDVKPLFNIVIILKEKNYCSNLFSI